MYPSFLETNNHSNFDLQQYTSTLNKNNIN